LPNTTVALVEENIKKGWEHLGWTIEYRLYGDERGTCFHGDFKEIDADRIIQDRSCEHRESEACGDSVGPPTLRVLGRLFQQVLGN
jgi:hypothetical protein